MITDEIIRCWRTNYGLEDNTPAEAAAWWEAKLGHAPSGAVAALGTCLEEIDRLHADLNAARYALAHHEIAIAALMRKIEHERTHRHRSKANLPLHIR